MKAVHYIEKCEHGTVGAQCRCPGPKPEVLVPCPPHCPERDQPLAMVVCAHGIPSITCPEHNTQALDEMATTAGPSTNEPDGWIIRHNRMTDTLHFGPFESREHMEDWYRVVGEPNGVSFNPVPVFLTVDWERRG